MTLNNAAEVLSGATYPTISLILLFRAEIAGALTELANDCDIVKSIKQQLPQALDKRLPVTELYVVAPWQNGSQNASVIGNNSAEEVKA